MDSKDKIMACLNILKRLPPNQMQKNAYALSQIIPEDYVEELFQRIDKPLELAVDAKTGSQFICSEFNRDGDSFRSALSNQYNPPIDDANYPSEYLRSLEEKANVLFDEYRKLYYEGGVSACYFWDKDDGGFATAWLVRKGRHSINIEDVDKVRGVESGSWSTINVIDVRVDGSKKKWTYKITSSVVLEMNITQAEIGQQGITGSLTKQKEESYQPDANANLDAFHLERIGSLVEDMEGTLRGYLDTIYVGKTKDIVFQTRLPDGEKEFQENRKKLAEELMGKGK